MSLTASPLTLREKWDAETEEIARGHLFETVRFFLRNPLRTSNEQDALLAMIDRLDYPGTVDAPALRQEATENWTRAHRCDCGEVSANYWCSDACYSLAEPEVFYGYDEEAAANDEADDWDNCEHDDAA